MPKYTPLTDRLYDYVCEHSTPPTQLERELIAETEEVLGGLALMQIAPEQAQLLAMLVRLSGARSAIEIGTFTGLSALAIAGALPADGSLLCCDVNEEWTGIGRRYWQRAGLDKKITLAIAPAQETLDRLPANKTFDFAFIDADKQGYLAYYERLLERMPSGGLIAVDNVFWLGSVADPGSKDEDTQAIRKFNAAVASDKRVEVVMLAVADGLSLIRKR